MLTVITARLIVIQTMRKPKLLSTIRINFHSFNLFSYLRLRLHSLKINILYFIFCINSKPGMYKYKLLKLCGSLPFKVFFPQKFDKIEVRFWNALVSRTATTFDYGSTFEPNLQNVSKIQVTQVSPSDHLHRCHSSQVWQNTWATFFSDRSTFTMH